jgi:hypothetical protein
MQRLCGWAVAHRGMEKKGLHAKTRRRKKEVGYAYAMERSEGAYCGQSEKKVVGNDAAGCGDVACNVSTGGQLHTEEWRKKGLHAKMQRRKEVVGYAYAMEPSEGAH